MFYTYTKVDSTVKPIDVLYWLQKKLYLGQYLGQFDYVIPKIIHLDTNVDYHVILTNNNKFEIINNTLLDIEFKGQCFHSNYQPVRVLRHGIEYICKDKDYITSIQNS